MDMIKSFALALTSMGICASAMAADMDYALPSSESLSPETPVVIGNGWYLRGDVAGTREYAPTITQDSALASAIRRRSGGSIGAGAGYQFSSWLRSDLTLDYRNNIRSNSRSDNFDCVTSIRGVDNATDEPVGINAVTNQCYSAQRLNFKRTTLLMNAYVDFGSWSGLTPYVGLGVGATYGQLRGSYNWFRDNDGSVYAPDLQLPADYPENWVTSSGAATTAPTGFSSFGPQNRARMISKSETNFTWALMAGVAIDVAANTKLDLGYRYVNTGRFSKGASSNEGQLHEYRAGLRYVID